MGSRRHGQRCMLELTRSRGTQIMDLKRWAPYRYLNRGQRLPISTAIQAARDNRRTESTQNVWAT
jgi:hypothetical protein